MFTIIANQEIKKNKTYIKKIQEHCKNLNINCEIANVKQDAFGNYIYHNINPNTKYILALGGDGTILQSVQNAIELDIPIIGIHTGTLGFLAEYKTKEIPNIIESILKNEFQIEERMLIEVYQNDILLDTCLNDVVISREGFSRIVSIEIKVGNEIVNQYRGDGVIISTPTGSTGYNLSLGGPIVSPKSNNILITPIACHSLFSRTIVLDSSEMVEVNILKSRKTQEKEAILTCDGRKNIDLHSLDSLKIKVSNQKVKLLKLENNNFFQICNNKLK